MAVLGTQVFTSGKSSAFSLGGSSGSPANTIHGQGWSTNAEASEIRTDNTADNGFSNRIVGEFDLKATLDFEWDCSGNIFDSPVQFQIGQVLTAVRLHLDLAGAGPFWYFPKAIVLTTPMESKVGAVIKVTISIANKGAFSLPAGTWTPSSPTFATPT